MLSLMMNVKFVDVFWRKVEVQVCEVMLYESLLLERVL